MSLLSWVLPRRLRLDGDALDRRCGYDQGWEDARVGLQNEFAWNLATPFSEGYRAGWTKRQHLTEASNF